jgi:hypothetical protein
MAMGLTVLNIHRGQDTGGWGWRMYNAFRQHAPGWTFRSVVRPNAFVYIAYPEDLTWLDAKRWWARADVVHLHNDFSTAKVMEKGRRPKPAVIQYHGSAFRANPSGVLEEQRKRGAIGLVSTLDLYLLSPDDLEWVGSPYDLDWLASLRIEAQKAA